MQFFPFRPTGATEPVRITYDAIISAMNEASSTGETQKSGRKYAVMNPETGETFSPKGILRIIIGDRRFAGGKGLNGANRPFQAFGFPLGRFDKLIANRKDRRNRKVRVLRTELLLKRLFQQRWGILPVLSELGKIKDGSFPGVYVLAYSEESLKGRTVKEKDVFYVGMTCEAGLNKRLYQFRQGITRGGCHSAADRFYKLWLRKRKYNPQADAKLYFAYLPIKCEKAKPWRSPEDIVTLGKTRELEFAAIARVKRYLHYEPLLNKM